MWGWHYGEKILPMYFCLRPVPLRGPRQSIFYIYTEQKEITKQHPEIQDPLGKNAALTWMSIQLEKKKAYKLSMQISLQWACALYSRMGRVDGSQAKQLVPLASVCVPSLNRTKGLWPFKTPGDWSTEDWGIPQESPRVSSPLKTLRRLMQDITYAQLRIFEDRQQWLPLLSFPDLESEV